MEAVSDANLLPAKKKPDMIGLILNSITSRHGFHVCHHKRQDTGYKPGGWKSCIWGRWFGISLTDLAERKHGELLMSTRTWILTFSIFQSFSLCQLRRMRHEGHHSEKKNRNWEASKDCQYIWYNTRSKSESQSRCYANMENALGAGKL